MEVHHFLFRAEPLNALEGVSELGGHMIDGLASRLRFDVTPSTELDPAFLALGDGVVGVVVGQFEDGSPALLAGEFDL